MEIEKMHGFQVFPDGRNKWYVIGFDDDNNRVFIQGNLEFYTAHMVKEDCRRERDKFLDDIERKEDDSELGIGWYLPAGSGMGDVHQGDDRRVET